MSKFNLGDRYDWRGEKHGPWRKGAGGSLQRRPLRILPVQFNTGPTPRHAVLDFVALIAEHPEAWDRA